MSEQYTYAVSRIHAKEQGLLNSADMQQLIQCGSYETAMKMLGEKGLGYGKDYESFEELQVDETDKLWSLISELVPEKEPFDILFRQIDFHNLKAAIKSVYTSEEPSGYFLSGGSIEPDVILDAVKRKDYADLPDVLASAAEGATIEFTKNYDGQECDIYIDRACLEAIYTEGKESGICVIEDYARMFTALSDIKIAVRAANTGKNRAFVDAALARCDELDVSGLAAAASKGIDEVYDFLEFTDYKDAVPSLKSSITEFEKWFDNSVMDLIKNQKSNPFTVSPIFAYILAKQNELKVLQIIMSGLRNGLDLGLVSERIRDLYV